MAKLHLFETAEEIGLHLADRLLREIQRARESGRRFVLGCPTGRTPRPTYAALVRRLSTEPQDLSHVVLVMMDEYLVEQSGELEYASDQMPWSCHYIARDEIFDQLNKSVPREFGLPQGSIWFPDASHPEAYDARIASVGGIDLFILASGASDGHVAFNPPGSPRDSRTRIIALSEQTRRDNLQTFPAFGALESVPRHGVSVGITTITAARNAVMVLTGESKRDSLSRILKADRYDPQWPATVVHEFTSGEILADRAAGAVWGKHGVQVGA